VTVFLRHGIQGAPKSSPYSLSLITDQQFKLILQYFAAVLSIYPV